MKVQSGRCVNVSMCVYIFSRMCLLRKYVECLTENALPFAFKLSLEIQYCDSSDWDTGIRIIAIVRWLVGFFSSLLTRFDRPNVRQTLFSLKIEIRVLLNNIKSIASKVSESKRANAFYVCMSLHWKGNTKSIIHTHTQRHTTMCSSRNRLEKEARDETVSQKAYVAVA